MPRQPDEEASELKASVQRELTRRRLAGEPLVALAAPAGSRKLVRSFWGRAWCHHLEQYSDYETRLPRGRSYLRQGQVFDLAVAAGQITATVAGSRLYQVAVRIDPLAPETWSEIKSVCVGQVASLLDLWSGKLGDAVLEAISDPEGGLFPHPEEIRFTCDCPDYADLCKHAAAVLYGVAVRFDQEPELFFTLRSLDPSELIASRESALSALGATDEALAGEDLSALFGINLQGDPKPL